ncbi:MAG: putative signal transduction protein with EAL and GGDEF domain [Glaciecola sp.]|jgi:predicted signal transduction protein with EAL and GGDEF domain
MPVSELKVDRSFVVDAVTDGAKGRAVLRTIAALGQGLGLAFVAEAWRPRNSCTWSAKQASPRSGAS